MEAASQPFHLLFAFLFPLGKQQASRLLWLLHIPLASLPYQLSYKIIVTKLEIARVTICSSPPPVGQDTSPPSWASLGLFVPNEGGAKPSAGGVHPTA